ncbi:MAG: branched-chain amino acid transporter permease [Oscillospiraceae bacterium]|jgi:branched-subunit amino acid transport protein AzlD
MRLPINEALLLVAVMALCTAATRVLPFLLFPGKRKTPKYIAYLGDILPFAIIGMLVVYCLKDISIFTRPWGLPEGIAILYIICIHRLKHNLLLSIGGGTVLYVLLRQFVLPF